MLAQPLPLGLNAARPRDTAPVLSGRPLVGDPSLTPRFGDDVWNLGVAGFAGNRYASEFLIDFKSLGHPVRREAAREFLFWRLNTRPSRGPLPSISTVAAEWWNLRCFFRFLDTEHEGLRLDAVTQPVLDAYLAHCRGEGLLASSVRHRLQVISRLHLAAQAVVTDALVINPWNGRPLTRVIGVEPTRKHENETPRIPPNVIGPLVQAALFYVRTAAKDIINARTELTELEASAEDIHGLSLNRLEHYLQGLADEGRGVPVVDGVGRQVHLAGAPAYTYVMRKSGAGRGVAGGVYDERIDRALELLGPESGGMDTPIAPHPRPVSPGGTDSAPPPCLTRNDFCEPPVTSSSPICPVCATPRSRNCGTAVTSPSGVRMVSSFATRCARNSSRVGVAQWKAGWSSGPSPKPSISFSNYPTVRRCSADQSLVIGIQRSRPTE